MSYLSRYYDPMLEVNERAVLADLTREEVDRIQRQAAVILYSSTLPRRLGEDASDDELASDKKTARRVLHVLKQCMQSWAMEPKEIKISEEMQIEAAQLVWETWWDDHSAYLEARKKYLATWATKKGETLWGKQALVKLSNESSWLEYALRG